ncbi:MAG: hypothetical protein ACRD2W_08400 [Acidimicrobiales bacterium]
MKAKLAELTEALAARDACIAELDAAAGGITPGWQAPVGALLQG